MKTPDYVFYLKNGTTTNSTPPKSDFFIQENLNEELYRSRYYYPCDRILYDLDARCVELYDVFQNKIFSSPDEYYRHIEMVPAGVLKAGLDSDFDLPKEWFEKYFTESLYADLVKNGSNNEQLSAEILEIDKHKYHYAYTADCQSLIASLQELISATNDSFIGFYKLLCGISPKDGMGDDYYAINSEGRLAFNMLYSLVVQIYSALDVATKIAYELEHLKVCSTKYERLASKSILYGDKTRLQMDVVGTIFEKCKTISIFENLRNELVHNATWEMHPKVFFKLEKGIVLERAIYMPDFTEEGTLVSYKNRKRFFADGKKINEELPALYLDFLYRLDITLNKLS